MSAMLQTHTEMLSTWHPIETRLGESVPALLEFPRYFEIETVNACNARCPMCTIDDWERRDGLMEDALFARIADEIGENRDSVRRVALYRDGEPLLDKKLPARIALLKAKGVKRVGISTNAALLTDRKSRELLEAGLDEIILSIDSLQPQVYEAIRPPLDFASVHQNCTGFIVLRNALKSSCQVWVRMIRQQANKDEWPEYERYWKGIVKPTDRVDYRDIHNWGGQLVNFRPIARANTEDPCVALWSLMVVFADGTVPLCNVDYNKTRVLGNLRTSTITDLWRSNEQAHRRGEHLERARTGICVGCTVWGDK